MVRNMVNKSRQAGGLGEGPKGASDAFAMNVSDSLSLAVKSTCTNLCSAEKAPPEANPMEGAVHIARTKDTTAKDDSTRGDGNDTLLRAAQHGRAGGVASRPAGYCMIESLEIVNFRAFKKLSLAGLKPLNILVGDNASGKTALLEAIFFAAGPSPEVGVRMRAWRGLEISTSLHTDIYEALWADLFCGFSRDSIIKIDLRGSRNDSRSLTIFYAKGEPITLPLLEKQPLIPATYTPVTFRWEVPGNDPVDITPRSTPSGLQIGVSPESNIKVFFLAAREKISPQIIASLYSGLSKTNQEQKFIDDIKEQFLSLRSVSVEVEAGAHMLFVSVDGLRRKIPINLFSNGASHLAGVLLHIAAATDGLVCIDEIENGIHHTRLARCWQQIIRAVKDSNAQVFASVHSLEALKAALPVLTEHRDDFSLIQAFRENGVSKAVVVPGKEAVAAIENDIELRG
jgi:AAA domain, putative AbiEii toxin, Type IV TA system/AAA ATPase domain